jgi:hypothetical protein
MCLAMAKLFTSTIILVILLPSAALALWFFGSTAWEWRNCSGQILRAWLEAPMVWKLISLLFLLLLGFGFTTIGGFVEGDAIAFYFAIAKVTAASQELAPLPGYEHISQVGLLAEMLIAALLSLGMPNISPRIYSWANYLPMLALLYGLSRHCGLGRRGSLLAVIAASTSSVVILFWGTGKTDLFAVGPALAACIFAIALWDRSHRRGAIALAGVFTGFACVFKLSYLLPFLPAVMVLILWNNLFDAVSAYGEKRWADLRGIFWRSLTDMTMFGAGITFAFIPHLIKNLYLMGKILGDNVIGEAFYSRATTLRLLLSYPLALTYGRYWAQFGTLSPIILAFFPLLFCLPRPKSWKSSRLGALTCTTVAGVVLWMALMPSIFMPRYFLATLLLLGIPAAAGAEFMSRQRNVISSLIPLAVIVVLITTPLHVNKRYFTFSATHAIQYIANPEDDCPMSPGYCEIHKAINAVAAPNARIFMLTYYRLWLRPDLLQRVSNIKELGYLLSDNKMFWERFQKGGFRYILLDTSIFPIGKELIASLPTGFALREIYLGGAQAAYEIVPRPRTHGERRETH